MGFEKEIAKIVNPLKQPYFFRYSVVYPVGAHFEGVVKIGQISTYSVTLVIKNHLVRVCGSSLSVERFEDSDLVLSGRITAVEVAL